MTTTINRKKKNLNKLLVGLDYYGSKDVVGKKLERNRDKLRTLNKELKSLKDDDSINVVKETIKALSEEIELIKYKTLSIELLEETLNDLDTSITSEIERLSTERELDAKEIQSVSEKYDKTIEDLKDNVSKEIDKIYKSKDTAELNSKIKDLKSYLDKNLKSNEESLTRWKSQIMSNVGGGNANRNITVNGASVLSKYTDINFVDSGTEWSTEVDDTNKRVNITASVAGNQGLRLEVPTGSVDGSNTTFTVSNDPTVVVIDDMMRREGKGYTYSGGIITVDPLTPPVYDIYSLY